MTHVLGDKNNTLSSQTTSIELRLRRCRSISVTPKSNRQLLIAGSSRMRAMLDVGQIGPKSEASSVPFHGDAGFGGAHRFAPPVEAPKGIPPKNDTSAQFGTQAVTELLSAAFPCTVPQLGIVSGDS
ncbi:hypothetical protein BCON_0074g00370 [Botryotinia convoluta]|uniref:Uncharacterized protein n=1 Tax=Botryotinia convoluta TaxID=54673 RepID=A0A4Z1ICQ7_9HELO|nr:hypothetical protein BCON_0074g00370 [Botryotinia convoluta]